MFVNRLLKTLTQQEGVSFEVIVIHDSEVPLNLWPVSLYSNYKVFYCNSGGKKGANYCRNIGLDKSVGEIVYFLDDDVYLPDETFLFRIWQNFKNLEGDYICGGYYKSPMGCSFPQLIYNSTCNLWVDKNWSQNWFILLGGNFFAKRSAIQNFRFDESASYGRDEELFYQQWRKKYPDAAPIIHEQFSIFHNSYLSWAAMAENSYRQQLAKPTTLKTIDRFFANPPKKIWLYLPTLIYILSGKLIFQLRDIKNK